ncbi:hypothetical protein AF335_08240 [Streptomyces eurocidicus]|uniref:Uncharacterized protein n=1 Tax=Streptomyces eurocidicus TaxID=66423 RepID=A0A2N8P0J4_STREU|nr:hypothetical protein [Streptomyces eurocidicus]MBB5122013.1 hypothetical protein [Streptomyces eurocidicus]PNE34540.1 hypothetical protein AF335_08240 [Streptomyces eurocidicus]
MGVTDPGRVDVEIGELVLHGFEHVDRDLLADAFRRELHRLVRDRGVPLAGDTGITLDLVRGLPPLPGTASPHRLGTALARAVHAGLAGRGDTGEPGRGSGSGTGGRDA